MQIINIKNKKWVVGLEWELLPNEGSIKEEAKEIAEKTNSNFGLIIEYDGQNSIGLSKKTKPKLPSANLYLALANQENKLIDAANNYYPDWIVIEEAGDDKYWMGIVKNGIPTPQSDSILDITSIKDRILDLTVNDTYTLYSKCPEIKTLFEGIKDVNDKDLNELTENISSKESFEKLRGIPNKVIYAGVALSIIGVFLYVGYSYLEGRTLEEKQRIFVEKQEQEKIMKEEAFKKELKIWEDQRKNAEVNSLNNIKLAMRLNPTGIVNSFYDLVGDVEVGTHGWDLGKIECYVNDTIADKKPEAACDILFNRTGLSTNRMFLQDYPEAVIKGDQALVTKKIKIEDSYIKPINDSILTGLYPSKDWGFDMISQLQLLKIVQIENEIKPSASITYDIPPKPVSPTEQASGITSHAGEQKTTNYAKGEIILKNSNFELMKEVIDNVDFKGISVKKATFEPKELGIINWTIQMDYYVKEDSSGGIAGSNSSALSDSAIKDTKINQQK